MVKYLALAMALVGSLVVVDLAQAGHRHHRRGGCHGGNCYAAPVGCANGACGVPVYAAPVGCANGACGVPGYGAPVHGGAVAMGRTVGLVLHHPAAEGGGQGR